MSKMGAMGGCGGLRRRRRWVCEFRGRWEFPRQECRDEILENLDRADVFILLLSQTSVASE